jgi:DNA repair exonuclease SbcCD ATPase subunit
MFEKNDRTQSYASRLKEELTEELASFKKMLSGVNQRSKDQDEKQSEVEKRLTGELKQLTDFAAQLQQQIKTLDSFMACPKCGIVLFLSKVPSTGGFLREHGKRCPLCDQQSIFDKVPLLPIKKF